MDVFISCNGCIHSMKDRFYALEKESERCTFSTLINKLLDMRMKENTMLRTLGKVVFIPRSTPCACKNKETCYVTDTTHATCSFTFVKRR